MSAAYDSYYFHNSTEDSSKYFGYSMAIHILIAVGSIFVTVPALELMKKDQVAIEIIEVQEEKPVLKSLAAPKGEDLPKTIGAQRIQSPAPSAPMDSELAPMIKAPVAKSKRSKSPIAKVKTKTGGGAKPIAKAVSAASRAGVPETLEDIQAPDLDADGVIAAQKGKLGDNEFENDFKKVDQSNQAAINAHRSELDNEAKMIADEEDDALKALEENNKAQARAMEHALKATRTKNAAMIAKVKAAEQAAAEKAARDAEIAKDRAVAARGSGQGSAGRGSGSEGADRAGVAASGSPNGVRSLEQLRQMPGNPKPQYSVDERLRKEQGLVAFHAYVTKSGTLSQIRPVRTTGFKTLDAKTIAAVKQWRFYPGQEGWVEIPFRWDLKGGVQELPTLLRRYGSR